MSALLDSLLTYEQRTAVRKADALAHYTAMAQQAANESADPSLLWVTVKSKILGGIVECGLEVDDPETQRYQCGALAPIVYLMAVTCGGMDWQQHLGKTTLDALQDEAEAAAYAAGLL